MNEAIGRRIATFVNYPDDWLQTERISAGEYGIIKPTFAAAGEIVEDASDDKPLGRTGVEILRSYTDRIYGLEMDVYRMKQYDRISMETWGLCYDKILRELPGMVHDALAANYGDCIDIRASEPIDV